MRICSIPYKIGEFYGTMRSFSSGHLAVHHFSGHVVHHHLVLLVIHHHVVHLLFHHHFLLWLLEGIDVLVDDTDEVGEKGADAGGNVKGDDNFLLSGGLDETNTIITSHNGILLVEEHEVACSPDGLEGDSDDNKQASGEEFSSAGCIVLGEENNDESRCDNQGCSENNTDENEPPVDVVVQELIEDLEEHKEGKGQDYDTNEEHSALNWEEAAAGQAL